MTEVDAQADQGWAPDRVAFCAEPVGEDWDRCSVSADGPLAQRFGALAGVLLRAETLHEAMTQVVFAASRIVPEADLVSITLRSPGGGFHTPVSTSETADELDRIQYRTSEGPCVAAAEQDGPGHALANDLGRSSDFPRFGPQAADLGFGSLLATTLLPDRSADRQPGAINLYSRRIGAFGAAAIDHALILSAHASVALAGTAAHTAAALREQHLRQAVDSRDVIGQAKGILMSRRGVSAEEAFDILRRTSQELNVKLSRLARTLTERHHELDG
ncbi:GAF and ANTAR domain-containing protein [Amycolatopsis sp. PS_44_ISF1]|uniref:GAF and ANTAR domain-containing protein n=1 Tax=Amycolatopsis sp. PS_44_ISF1 TaxID=2974917 RepID=UPI0028DFB40E|nr:GAF and ANTAR domain-containing protein [Amycolatopsis sp. PS_44_ISF1]MDT8915155.1 GAF and ANTAR domain-containing protein [Amycolatopsis sp. PS_44_ISF1]